MENILESEKLTYLIQQIYVSTQPTPIQHKVAPSYVY